MATSIEFIEYVCEQISGIGIVRYRKMFGEYMVYINDKPILLVCDNTVFVKELECIKELMKDADRGVPYPGSKEHYVLNIDDPEFCKTVIAVPDSPDSQYDQNRNHKATHRWDEDPSVGKYFLC